MNTLHLTGHAAARSQQRRVPPAVRNWLWDFGARSAAGEGCERLYLDKKGHRGLQRELGSSLYAKIRPELDHYLVVKDDTIITVGHRTERVKRNMKRRRGQRYQGGW